MLKYTSLQQNLTSKSLLLKLTGNSYTINQNSPDWKQFPIDLITKQHLSQRKIQTYEWIQNLRLWLNAGPVLARTFMNRTVSIIMLLFILTVAGVIVAQIVDNTSLGLIIMIVGCVALFAYTIIAIISLRKKAKQIRRTLTSRIQDAEHGQIVKIEEIYATGCPCCPPLLPLIINIYTNAH